MWVGLNVFMKARQLLLPQGLQQGVGEQVQHFEALPSPVAGRVIHDVLQSIFMLIAVLHICFVFPNGAARVDDMQGDYTAWDHLHLCFMCPSWSSDAGTSCCIQCGTHVIGAIQVVIGSHCYPGCYLVP